MRHELPVIEHVEAHTIQEACAVLSENGGSASPVAGGTDLLVRMKYRASEPRVLVDLKKIPEMSQIEVGSEGELVVGALTKLHKLDFSPEVRRHSPLLSQAAASVANRTIRNMGTVGGNLCQEPRCEYYTHSHVFGREYWPKCMKRGGECCHIVKKGDRCHARYSSDIAPALVALGANAEIASANSKKIVSVEEFFSGTGHPVNCLQPDELLTRILIPPTRSGWVGVYLKYSYRETTDYPIVGVAALADMRGSLCNDLRIVVGSVASAPMRLKGVEEMLKGAQVTEAVLAKVQEKAMAEVKPVQHHGDSAKYVRAVLGSQTREALRHFLM